MADGAYSFSLTTFNPSGKLLQIEYASKAVEHGGSSIGIKSEHGIILATERKVASPLIVAEEVHKIFALDEHLGCVYSGIGPDAKVLISKARKLCQTYRLTYEEPTPVRQIVREMASVMQEYTQSGGSSTFWSLASYLRKRSSWVFALSSGSWRRLFSLEGNGDRTRRKRCTTFSRKKIYREYISGRCDTCRHSHLERECRLYGHPTEHRTRCYIFRRSI